jgi:hypothetical protein
MSSHPVFSKLRRTLKWLAISLAVLAAIWLAILAWWQTTHRAIGTADVLIYLLGLPLLVLVCIALLYRRASPKINAAVHQATSEAPATVLPRNGAASSDRLPIIGTWAATSLGMEATPLIEALSSRRNRPTPDEQLLDDAGFPLLGSRAKDLDMNAVKQDLVEIIAAGMTDSPPAPDEWRDAPLRSLALLHAVLDQILREWPLPAFDSAREEDAPLPLLRGSSGLGNPGFRFDMEVKLLVSASLKPYEREFIRTCVARRLKAIPQGNHPFNLDVIAAEDDTTALKLAHDFHLAATGTGCSQALLLLAADSSLCPSVVEDWASRDVLFDPRRPNGLMMGEAAFAVLFVNDTALQATSIAPLCHMAPVFSARRQSSADSPGKASHDCLAEIIEAALEAASLASDAVAMVICDTDHRISRVLECVGAMTIQTPQLDAIQNRLALNESCGYLGAASVPGLLATGAMQVHRATHPVLLFNVSHSIERAAAVLLPADDSVASVNVHRTQAA